MSRTGMVTIRGDDLNAGGRRKLKNGDGKDHKKEKRAECCLDE